MASGLSISPSKPISIMITTTGLHDINLGGKNQLHANGIKADHFAVQGGGKNTIYLQGDIKVFNARLGGKSELHANIQNADMINLKIAGKNTIYLSGRTKDLIINSAGKSDIFAESLIADQVILAGAGKPNMTVHALKTLSIETMGESTVKYYGNPKINKQAFGEVYVEKMDDNKK